MFQYVACVFLEKQTQWAYEQNVWEFNSVIWHGKSDFKHTINVYLKFHARFLIGDSVRRAF